MKEITVRLLVAAGHIDAACGSDFRIHKAMDFCGVDLGGSFRLSDCSSEFQKSKR